MNTFPPNQPVVQLIETEDGSSSLFIPALNETYHSFHGAIGESKHVFIANGLAYFSDKHSKDVLNVLEVGFGTGLNALLTLLHANATATEIQYNTMEPYPLAPEVIEKLNYPAKLDGPGAEKYFLNLHGAAWGISNKLSPHFTFRKYLLKLEDFTAEKGSYDVVFFDAFAPSKQAELWTESALQIVYEALSPSGVLVTYCAQGQFKRNLKAVGFEVQTLPGPRGKKEMVRAVKLA